MGWNFNMKLGELITLKSDEDMKLSASLRKEDNDKAARIIIRRQAGLVKAMIEYKKKDDKDKQDIGELTFELHNTLYKSKFKITPEDAYYKLNTYIGTSAAEAAQRIFNLSMKSYK